LQRGSGGSLLTLYNKSDQENAINNKQGKNDRTTVVLVQSLEILKKVVI
jgi:hypothetical protein